MQKQLGWILILGMLAIVFYLIINEFENLVSDTGTAIANIFSKIGSAFSAAFGWIGNLFSKPA